MRVVYNEVTEEIKVVEFSMHRNKMFREINIIKFITKENKYIPVGTMIFTKGSYLPNKDWKMIGVF